ncbi:hypothetical protein LAB08_R33460 [Pseudomonas izuensis]|uniref:DUF1190 domain-containing protein n=2 Tax=Pseudomonas izuensis TaxID=2684212 RepID=A0ABM7RSL9_9PSED|nr:hypothetical protein LAB08_R33460 [Pseudomonas izuensis]
MINQGAIGEEIPMNNRPLLLLVSLGPTLVFAEGCDVLTRSQSPSVPVVETHSCYEYEGMPVNAIDWSCSNESRDMLASTRKKVEKCADLYQATCTATLTQESLANPHATSKDKNSNALNIPDNAQVTTYYYGAEHMDQARIDCESGGGQWKAK